MKEDCRWRKGQERKLRREKGEGEGARSGSGMREENREKKRGEGERRGTG